MPLRVIVLDNLEKLVLKNYNVWRTTMFPSRIYPLQKHAVKSRILSTSVLATTIYKAKAQSFPA
jgi:hypothetical protein